jgi:hypothetical protein
MDSKVKSELQSARVYSGVWMECVLEEFGFNLCVAPLSKKQGVLDFKGGSNRGNKVGSTLHFPTSGEDYLS